MALRSTKAVVCMCACRFIAYCL